MGAPGSGFEVGGIGNVPGMTKRFLSGAGQRRERVDLLKGQFPQEEIGQRDVEIGGQEAQRVKFGQAPLEPRIDVALPVFRARVGFDKLAHGAPRADGRLEALPKTRELHIVCHGPFPIDNALRLMRYVSHHMLDSMPPTKARTRQEYKRALRGRGLKAELARRADVHPSLVTRWLQGHAVSAPLTAAAERFLTERGLR